jgi:hypothetical protein
MIYEYCRINLKQTNYKKLSPDKFCILKDWNYGQLNSIYKEYCKYKNFKSVMPIFIEDFRESDVLGYYDNGELVAWSMILRYPSQLSVTADQFAWNYKNPRLELGYNSLKNECAYYKELGYEYLYLHGVDEYKKEFDGFEILGPA